VALPWPCPNEIYDARMAEMIRNAHLAGIEQMAFGDLYLEDIRDYRVSRLAGTGLAPLFPIWCGAGGTPALAREMVDAGLRAIVTSVDTTQLDAGFLGGTYDAAFIAALPPGVDPCGENGEFHTFCHAAPAFAQAIDVRAGAIAERDGFVYCDVIAAGADR
jgi:diphthamide synthase (EF-2-diphthine--ammonia ligase)